MQRVSVVGNSGSGKTTVARQLAFVMDVPFVELDAIFHQPDWQDLAVDEFRRRVREQTEAPAWVVDGNYSAVRDLVWQRADTVVWVDPAQALVMARVGRRTLRRVVTREELWNGNREPWSNLYSLDPTRSIVVWAWTQRAKYRKRYGQAISDPAWSHLEFIRLRTRRDALRLLDRARARPAAGRAADGPAGR
ncbi:MAG TPA: AAA family ATPase [Acidimicrobiales bacterium]|nr:AAA family ATPase [Acidimicrobiales bacterium]